MDPRRCISAPRSFFLTPAFGTVGNQATARG
jgi:hypothetical protein